MLTLSLLALPAPVFAAELTPSQTLPYIPEDTSQVEGWIVRIDYTRNIFRVLDPRGFEKYVKTKPGIIGDYRMGDKVRVVMDPDYKVAKTIEKIS